MFLGLISPNHGEAKLKDYEGNDYILNASTRHLFAYVPQGNTIFSGTIADNLRMVKEDASDEDIIQALQSACAYDFVKELDKGIYSEIGARGRGLSEGQAQRIAIARAILRDAPILLLDEATSALDNTTEILIQQALDRLCKNRTTIVVAHRLSTIKNADEIAVISEGKIIEMGNHDELIKQDGIYANLYNLQFTNNHENLKLNIDIMG